MAKAKFDVEPKLVGIVYSPGFGAGWSTWGSGQQALDQELAHAITNGEPMATVVSIVEKNWPDAYTGGLRSCTVEWVAEGTHFIVEEYDGSESLRFNEDFMKAKPWVKSDD